MWNMKFLIGLNLADLARQVMARDSDLPRDLCSCPAAMLAGEWWWIAPQQNSDFLRMRISPSVADPRSIHLSISFPSQTRFIIIASFCRWITEFISMNSSSLRNPAIPLVTIAAEPRELSLAPFPPQTYRQRSMRTCRSTTISRPPMSIIIPLNWRMLLTTSVETPSTTETTTSFLWIQRWVRLYVFWEISDLMLVG